MSIRLTFDFPLPAFRLSADLSLPGQGVSALLGESGAGKTSLLRALAGLDRRPGSVVRIGDQVWQDAETFVPVHHRRIGYVFQESSLFPHLSVRRNIAFARKESGPTANSGEIEELLGITPLLDRMPDALSGGERRRVAIARALSVAPDILLLDEPMASLDRDRRHKLMPYLRRLHRHLSIPMIYVSHSLREVATLADHVVLLSKGRVVAEGSVGDVLTRADLPVAGSDDAAAVVEAVVASHDDDWELTMLELGAESLCIPRSSRAVGESIRLRLAARDVSICLDRPAASSILNVLPSTIESIEPQGGSQAHVRLQLASCHILARVTRKSVADLSLKPGMAVYAQVKSVAVLT